MSNTIDTNANRAKLVLEMRQHRAADRIVKGQYWLNGKGCAVGCAMHSLDPKGRPGDRARLGELTDAPKLFWKSVDRIFEALPNASSQEWPVRVTEALDASGKDCAALEMAIYRTLALTVDCALKRHADEATQNACAPALAIAWKRARGEAVDRAAADAANAAADAAACAAARANAYAGADAAQVAAYASCLSMDAADSLNSISASYVIGIGWREIADTLLEEIAR